MGEQNPTQPQLRQNSLNGNWVVIAPSRSKRPFGQSPSVSRTTSPEPSSATSTTSNLSLSSSSSQQQQQQTQTSSLFPYSLTGSPLTLTCPFCPGNEERDLEIDTFPAGETEKWTMRIVRNKFPALQPLQENKSQVSVSSSAAKTIPAFGFHEVVVTSRFHQNCIALQTINEVADILKLVSKHCSRLISDHLNDLSFISVFENHGPLAGSSLKHPHWQIIALGRAGNKDSPNDDNTLPPKFDKWNKKVLSFSENHCFMCEEIQEERNLAQRIISETPHFISWILFAAETPFQICISPKRHSETFLNMKENELEDLSSLIQRILHALYIKLNDSDYNMAFVDAPLHCSGRNRMHWYVLIDVKLTQLAGFELATGMAINPQLPEISASILRPYV